MFYNTVRKGMRIMSENIQFIMTIGILILIFGAYFGALALAGWYDQKERQKRGEPPRFDERQRIARLRAGNHTLYALLVFLILWTVLDQMDCGWLGNAWSMLFCALLLAWGVWTADCILHDGFIGWKEKNSSNTMALSWAAMLFMNMNSFHSSGVTDSWLPMLFAGGIALILAAIVLYQYRLEKRAEKEGEDL